MSSSTPNGPAFLAFGLLPLDDVLPDERLVLDENDEPSEMIEFGRCKTFALSADDDENELRSFGAVEKNKISHSIIIHFAK